MKVILYISFLICQLSVIGQITGRVNYENLGISFTIPDGWMGQEGENMLLLGSNEVSGLIFLSTHNLTLDNLITESKSGILDENGTNLRLSSEIEVVGDKVAGFFEGTLEWESVRAYVIGVANPNGVGVTIMSVTTPDQFGDIHKSVSEEIYNSLDFKKRDLQSELQEWREWLANSRLTYMNSGYSSDYTDDGISGGYSSERRIDLCGKGYFTDSSTSDVSVSGSGVSGYSYGNGDGQGNWEVKLGPDGNFLLLLNYSNGASSEYTLEYIEEQLYLDGTKYFITSEGEYAPNCN